MVVRALQEWENSQMFLASLSPRRWAGRDREGTQRFGVDFFLFHILVRTLHALARMVVGCTSLSPPLTKAAPHPAS